MELCLSPALSSARAAAPRLGPSRDEAGSRPTPGTAGFWSTGLPALTQALGYQGPERRGGAALLTRLLTLMLDEIDYGLLLLADGGRVLHANHAARSSLAAPDHPLLLQGHELRARLQKDATALHQALHAAASRGLRKLLTVGEGGERAGIAVVPLLAPAGRTEASPTVPATLLVIGRREVAGGLSVQGFAREHRLSPSEAQVLSGLCEGRSPNDIAARHGVKIATVRTQIANIRAKTGAESIRDLVQQVAVLPPMVGALRRQADLPALASGFGASLMTV
ncbi:helix-turn-helix transcriptional regulator [Ideonella sp. DXS29W]|uniref:Helix-turn-helix transcriptional regulator n=1 Tax=Ideonella lacteola TaxID=2984193 RepID=A0ABU9BLU6_9BURK